MAVARLVFVLTVFWTATADDAPSVMDGAELQVIDKEEQKTVYSEDQKVQDAAEALAALNAANAIKEGKDEAMKDLADMKESMLRQRQQLLQSQSQADWAHMQQAQLQMGSAGHFGQQWPAQFAPHPHQMHHAQHEWQQVCDALRCSGLHARYTDALNEFMTLGSTGQPAQWSAQQSLQPQQMQQPQYAWQGAEGAGQVGQQVGSSAQWGSQQSVHQPQQPQHAWQGTGGAGQVGQQAGLSAQQVMHSGQLDSPALLSPYSSQYLSQAHLQANQQAQEWQNSHMEMIDLASKQAAGIYQTASPSVRRTVDTQVFHDDSYLR